VQLIFLGDLGMKKEIMTTVASMLFAATASAADLPVKAVPPPPVAQTWAGFYLGANAGYSFGTASFSQDATFTSTALGSNPLLVGNGNNSVKGAFAGGQIGYNWQFSSAWLVGLEADWQWADQRGSYNNCTPPASTVAFFGAGGNGLGYCLGSDQRITNFGTARVRTGAIVRDSLWYVTGGAAWGGVEDRYAFTGSANTTIFPAALQPGPFLPAAGSFSTNRVGWTIGGGVETRLSGNWSVKLEYLHVDLGNITESVPLVPNPAFGAALNTGFSGSATTRTHITDDLVRVGLNYQFSGPVVAKY
jgi:outer membrane immunogenic protein